MWQEIDRRLYQGQAAVMTLAEARQALQAGEPLPERVDVVVTATFAPASWGLLFFRPALPTVARRVERAWLGDVPLQSGQVPGEFLLHAATTAAHNPRRGGAHLLEAWLAGERLPLRLELRPGAATLNWSGSIGLADLEAARLLVQVRSLRRGQVAVNSQGQPLPCEYGLLLPGMENAAHTWMGPWEPALLDPDERAIIAGLPVLLAGGVGRVAWREERDIALSADLHAVRREYLRPLTIPGYGIGLSVGVGWPVVMLDERSLLPLHRPETDLWADVVDYGTPLPHLGQVHYADLAAGTIPVAGRPVPVTSLASPTRAARLAADLKARLLQRAFPPLSPPVRGGREETA